jgi:hypothetical protein
MTSASGDDEFPEQALDIRKYYRSLMIVAVKYMQPAAMP